jgi:hypothetical protein
MFIHARYLPPFLPIVHGAATAAYLPSYHIAWKMPIPFPLRIRILKQGRVGEGSLSNLGEPSRAAANRTRQANDKTPVSQQNKDPPT